MFKDPAGIDDSPGHEAGAAARCTAIDGRLVVKRCSRLERAEKLEKAAVRLAAGPPQRQVAEGLGLARSTLQDWSRPVAAGAAPAALAAWVETPEGVRWLHQLVLAAHFTITLQGGAGIRVVCQFLELSGLSAFVGTSYGAHQGLNVALEEAVVAVEDEQRAALARDMPHRQITACEDDTFHPQTCLVALEPVSGFLVLEKYAENRKSATWTQTLQTSLVGLKVTVIQGTSDGAPALHRHVEVELGAHHSPDLFHGQHEVSKATSLCLARKVQQAAAAVATAQTRCEAERAARQAYQELSPRPRGSPTSVRRPHPGRPERCGAGRNRAHRGAVASG
jgi:hypothetical protein